MIAVLVLAAAMLLPVAGLAAPLEYKGVPLGTPMEEAKSRLSVRTCSTDGTMCVLSDSTYASEGDVTVVVRFIAGNRDALTRF